MLRWIMLILASLPFLYAYFFYELPITETEGKEPSLASEEKFIDIDFINPNKERVYFYPVTELRETTTFTQAEPHFFDSLSLNMNWLKEVDNGVWFLGETIFESGGDVGFWYFVGENDFLKLNYNGSITEYYFSLPFELDASWETHVASYHGTNMDTLEYVVVDFHEEINGFDDVWVIHEWLKSEPDYIREYLISYDEGIIQITDIEKDDRYSYMRKLR